MCLNHYGLGMRTSLSSISPKQAFSLVELSIVLVILGLLVGGILAGQSLIRAAELRSVATEYNRYVTATHSFRDKYFALPGDMTNAEAFWGTMSAGTCPNATAGTGTQTCNGDGNGQLRYSGAANQSNELFTYWQHLANAGLIEGSYTGIAGSAGAYRTVIGTNVPASKLPNAGWTVLWEGTKGSGSQSFAGNYGNVFYFGAQASGNDVTYAPLIKPEEAWNSDKKIDDGLPGTGKLRVLENTSSVTPGCATTDDASTAEYALSNSSKLCSFIFPEVF